MDFADDLTRGAAEFESPVRGIGLGQDAGRPGWYSPWNWFQVGNSENAFLARISSDGLG